TLGTQPQGIAYDGQRFYYAMDDNDGDPEKIYIYDPAVGDTVGSIPIVDPISKDPRGLAWDGQYLWLVADPVGPAWRALFQIDVRGQGTPAIVVNTAPVQFGLTTLGDTTIVPFNIANIGTDTLRVTDVQFDTSAFFLQNPSFPIKVPPNQARTINLSFAPTLYGTVEGTMTIFSNDVDDPQVQVPLRGKGLYPDPRIGLTASQHDFGDIWVPADGLTSWWLGVFNKGMQTLELQDFFLTNPAFSVQVPALPFSLAPDETLMVRVWFSAQQPIVYQDTLRIFSNDSTMPMAPVVLTGRGMAGPFGAGFQFWQFLVPDNPVASGLDKRVEGLKVIGDLNLDSQADVVLASEEYLIIALNGSSAGTADTLWRFNTCPSTNNCGSISLNGLFSAQKALQVTQDLDGDGFMDVVAATDGGNEHVYVLSGRTGSVIWQFGDDNDPFLGGFGAVDARRDFNGDGVPDVLAVASSNSQGLGHRSAYLFNGTNGNLLWQYPVPEPGQVSGYAIISLDDVTGDGVPDAVAGFGGDGVVQYAVALNGATGQMLWKFATGVPNGAKELLELPVPGETPDVIVADFFGDLYRLDGQTGNQLWHYDVLGIVIELALLPDINGDGLAEVLVANFAASSRIFCLSGADGQVLWTMPTVDWRSYSVRPVPDLNGDGVADVLAGDQAGFLYVFSGTGDSLIYQQQFPGTRVYTVNWLPSLDGNASAEILVGLDDGHVFALSGGSGPVGVQEDAQPVPARFALEQNYPNPFNPATTIAFSLPAGAVVRLTIYNSLGQVVARPLDGVRLPAGRHQIRWEAGSLPSGVYFYRLEAGGFSQVRKMLYLR
ncbi:MAG: choice-of-anchor D domain-containing protein, partial [Calditrichaeota bacterium]